MAKQGKIKITDYYRVSTKSEAQKTSMTNQPKYIQALLRDPQNSKYKHIGTSYFDWGISGTKLSREGFDRMLRDAGLKVEIERKDDITSPINPNKKIRQIVYNVSVDGTKKPKFEEIWVKTTSRFARNINAYRILEVLRQAGVYVYFIDIDKSTRDRDNLPIIRKKLDSAMEYSEQLSRNRKIVQSIYEEENRLSGCPYGYTYHKKTKTSDPYYSINPKEGPVVERIFDLCIQGYGTQRICNILDAEGIKAPKGKKFGPTSIRNILKQEKYMGLNSVGKWTSGEIFEKLPSPVIREDYHQRLAENEGLPILIPPEVWYKAAEAVSKRTIQTPNGEAKGGIKQAEHSFREVLKCSYCGNHFVYDNNGGRGYYACATKENKGMKACNCNNVYAYKLEELLGNLAKGELRRLIDLDFENNIFSLLTLIKLYVSKIQEIRSKNGLEEIEQLEGELEKKQLAQTELLKSLTAGSFSESTIQLFQTQIKELDDEVKSIQEAIQNISNPLENSRTILGNLFKIVFEELEVLKAKKQEYSKEEVLDILEAILVSGQTKCNSGGIPPNPILVPILKGSTQAQGLLKAGYTEFKYRFRVPSDAAFEIMEREDIGKMKKRELLKALPKEPWNYLSSKYILNQVGLKDTDTTPYFMRNLGNTQDDPYTELLAATNALYEVFKGL